MASPWTAELPNLEILLEFCYWFPDGILTLLAKRHWDESQHNPLLNGSRTPCSHPCLATFCCKKDPDWKHAQVTLALLSWQHHIAVISGRAQPAAHARLVCCQ